MNTYMHGLTNLHRRREGGEERGRSEKVESQ